MSKPKTTKIKSRREVRIELTQIVYKFELFENKIDSNQVFEEYNLNDYGTKIINSLEKNYNQIIKIYEKIIATRWNWKRIAPLVRSFLLLGAIELYDLDKKIVIFEYVELAKIFIPDDTYKFVNSSLDFISKVYENYENKKTRKTN